MSSLHAQVPGFQWISRKVITTTYLQRSDDKVSSGFTTLTANGFVDLSDQRTVFTIGLGGGVTYYYDRPGSKTDNLANLTINLVHKVNERMTLTLSSYSTYQVQPQFDLLVAQNRNDGQYYYTTESLSLSRQWTRRFSTVTGYQLTGIFYEDALAKVQNDYVQQTFSNQFRFLLEPTTTFVAEYRLGLVNYLYENDRNTMTNYALVGFDKSFSPKWSMTARAGGEIQDQSVGGSDTSPYAEITTNYAYQRYSSLSAYFNYGFQYSNLAITQTNKALRLGVTINHGFTPKLSAYLGVFYENDNYSQVENAPGSAFTENTFNVNTGVRFAVTPKLSLQAGYQHTQLLSESSPSRNTPRISSPSGPVTLSNFSKGNFSTCS